MNTYDIIKMGLDATNLRSQTIANNIANINTEGYKRHYVTFEETLNDAMPKIEEKTDNSKGLRVDGIYISYIGRYDIHFQAFCC